MLHPDRFGPASARHLEREVERLIDSAAAAAGAGLGAECAVVGLDSVLSSTNGGSGWQPLAGEMAADKRTVNVPIRLGGQTIGELLVRWPSVEAACEGGARLEPIVDHLRNLVATLLALRSTIREVDTFAGITMRLHDHLENPDGVLDLVVDQAVEVLNAEMGWIALVDDQRQFLSPVVARGWKDDRFLGVRIALGSGIGGAAIAERHPIVISDYRQDAPATEDEARRAVIDAGVVSLLCAPMFRDEEMVGALYVANRHPTTFHADDVSLLTALSAEAGLAIANRRLYAQIRDQRDVLERSFAAHRELTAASLSGVGLEGIGKTLAKLLGRPVTIEQTVCEPWVLHCEPECAAAPDGPGVTHLVIAGQRQLGVVTAHGLAELSPLQLKALEHGATVLALELMKQHVAIETEDRVAGDLLQELVDSDHSVSDSLVRRARRLGLDLEEEHRVLILSDIACPGRPGLTPHHPMVAGVRAFVARHLATSNEKPIVVKRGDEIVIITPAIDEDINSLAKTLQALATERGHGSVAIGIGPSHASIAQSARLARACLAVGLQRGGRAAIVAFDDLGPLRFLLDAPDRDVSTDIIQEVIGPVREYDRRARTPLLGTVRAYIACDGNHARTAERLSISISTLKYRLGKLDQLLGAPLSDPTLRFRLKLAFSLLELFEAC